MSKKNSRKYSMVSKPGDKRVNRWSLETSRSLPSSLLVVCPRCGEIGRLYWSRKLGWYVKHGSRVTHSVSKDTALEIPLHHPRLNLIKYMGGDTHLLPYLAKMIPPHTCYVEVFGGGAPLLLNKPPSKIEVYNDVDGLLVNLFKVVKERYDDFVKELEWALYSRQMYYEMLERLPRERDPVKRAAMYFLIIRMSFSGIFGTGFSAGPHPSNSPTYLLFNAIDKLKIIHERLKNVIIEHLDFRECIKLYDRPYTFFYIDPPHLFYATEKDRRYYHEGAITGSFTEKDYMELLDILTKVKGKWLLKQNYIPFIVDWAKRNNYDMTILKLTKSASKSMDSRETMRVVFIANYSLRHR